MTEELAVEILPRPHLRNAEEVKAARARIYHMCRQLAHLAHEIQQEVKRWDAYPLPRLDEMYLAMTLDAIEAARRKPERCAFPGPEMKMAAE